MTVQDLNEGYISECVIRDQKLAVRRKEIKWRMVVTLIPVTVFLVVCQWLSSWSSVSHCLSDCLSVTVFLVVCQWLSSWSSVSDCLPGRLSVTVFLVVCQWLSSWSCVSHCHPDRLSVTVFLVVCQSLSSWSSVSDCLPGRLSGISNLCPRQQCTETRPGFEKLKVHSF